MKVLLTGATGYIGAAVSDHLAAAGHQVVGVTRAPRRTRPGTPGWSPTPPTRPRWPAW
ncbi:NAD-dependent epimerase/dehydratase family protein [Streptomyces diastatochromogenes]|nr:NAD-dependent epimerase/dehydratase family protein [Streptomyces diastatochromogenes]